VRDLLAERLLANVMGWEDADVARERPTLQALADYKYDEYEQFEPGRRFIESLARWLEQFPNVAERQTAYRIFRERLIFISRAEMQHLVGSVYPDVVRPNLLARAAADLGVPEHLIARVAGDRAFTVRERSCLYVGLSDGARTDVLRRANPRHISNEQVVADYHSLKDRKDSLLGDLREDLRKKLGEDSPAAPRFTTVVLLDDFSASGISYIRPEEAGKGKIARVAALLSELTDLIDRDDLKVMVVLFVATERAIEHLSGALSVLAADVGGEWEVDTVQCLGSEIVIVAGTDSELDQLIQNVYDPIIDDKHMKKGGSDGRYGFADCGLPVVLAHNTPNNSIALLWADTDRVRALFPRVTRHREET
jgi:hypothetical protein